MDEVRSREYVTPALALGGCLMLGLIVGGWVLGAQVKAMKMADRYVTVKGLVERTVKSDRAIWAVSFKTAGDDLSSVFAKSEADKNTVLKFFADQEIGAGEVSVGQIKVTDKQTNEYGGNQDRGSRYILKQTVTVSSGDVDKVSPGGGKDGGTGTGGCGAGELGEWAAGWDRVQVQRLECAEAGHDHGGDAECAGFGRPVCGGFGEPGGADPVGESGGLLDCGE